MAGSRPAGRAAGRLPSYQPPSPSRCLTPPPAQCTVDPAACQSAASAHCRHQPSAVAINLRLPPCCRCHPTSANSHQHTLAPVPRPRLWQPCLRHRVPAHCRHSALALRAQDCHREVGDDDDEELFQSTLVEGNLLPGTDWREFLSQHPSTTRRTAEEPMQQFRLQRNGQLASTRARALKRLHSPANLQPGSTTSTFSAALSWIPASMRSRASSMLTPASGEILCIAPGCWACGITSRSRRRYRSWHGQTRGSGLWLTSARPPKTRRVLLLSKTTTCGRSCRQEPVKKADRKVRPPGDVLLVTITMR